MDVDWSDEDEDDEREREPEKDERRTEAPLGVTRLGMISLQMAVEELEGKFELEEERRGEPVLVGVVRKGKGRAVVQ